jgi:NAD(P)-dependent dehydrogenase (short-subunit alcohol dehydrogenase family)
MSESLKVAIVGAAGGIGRELARRLADSGVGLFLGGRSEQGLDQLASELGCGSMRVEAGSFDQMDAFIGAALEDLGSLTGAVNLAGSLLLKPAHLTTEDEFSDALRNSLYSSFGLVRSMGRLVRKGPVSIVLMSSAVARTGLANHEAMAGAKAGVAGLALAAAATYARRGFRVNAVAPGLVETPLTEPIVSRERARDASLALHPLGRLGSASEVAGMIAWLLSDEASWMTGQTLHVDGGLSSIKL